MRKIQWLFVFVVLLSIVSCGTKAKEEKSNEGSKTELNTKNMKEVPSEYEYIVKIGDKLPEFTTKLIDGSTFSTSDLKGKVVMLQFTASWCPVCRKEMPHIESDIWLKHKNNKDFVLVGVDRDEPLEKVQNFQKEMKITYPLALDPGADIFALFAPKEAGITRNVIVDKEGKIVFMTRLYKEDEFKEMCKVIDKLLEE